MAFIIKRRLLAADETAKRDIPRRALLCLRCPSRHLNIIEAGIPTDVGAVIGTLSIIDGAATVSSASTDTHTSGNAGEKTCT